MPQLTSTTRDQEQLRGQRSSNLGAVRQAGSNLTVTGNTLVSSNNLVTYYTPSSKGSITWDNNKYEAGSAACSR